MQLDPTTTEIIRNSLVYASEEMGIALRNSAYSPNIRERLDHSAAIFDDQGRLLAQAEHIPVHLGSLPWGLVKTLEYCDREGIDLEESSMMMVNNPYIAGTHLNDVTVIRPIYQKNRFVYGAVTSLTSKSRTPIERKGDLKAQTAANVTGERRVLELVNKYGWKMFHQACAESLKKT